MPHKITVDRGKALLAEFKIMIANEYGIPCKSISTRNPLANAIVHQAIGNILNIFKIQEIGLDHNNPLEGILSSTMFAIRSTVPIMMQHTLSHVECGRDAILNVNQKANWQLIK